MIKNHNFKRTYQKNRKPLSTIHLNNLLSLKILIKKLSKHFKLPSGNKNLLLSFTLKQNQSMTIRSNNLVNIKINRQINLRQLVNIFIKPIIKTKLWIAIIPLDKNLIQLGYNYKVVLPADNVLYAVQVNLLWSCIIAPSHQDILGLIGLAYFIVWLAKVRLGFRQ